MVIYNTLQKEINRILLIVGAEALIDYLRNYENNHPYKEDFTIANQIINDIIREFNVSLNNLRDTGYKTNDSVNARRLSVYFISLNTKLSKNKIKEFLNIGNKTFSDYLKYVNQVIEEPNTNKEFSEKIIKIAAIWKKEK
jgi:hypothetical protein